MEDAADFWFANAALADKYRVSCAHVRCSGHLFVQLVWYLCSQLSLCCLLLMKVLKEVMVDRAKRERHTISNSVSIYIHVYNHTMLI